MRIMCLVLLHLAFVMAQEHIIVLCGNNKCIQVSRKVYVLEQNNKAKDMHLSANYVRFIVQI